MSNRTIYKGNPKSRSYTKKWPGRKAVQGQSRATNPPFEPTNIYAFKRGKGIGFVPNPERKTFAQNH